MAKRRVKLELSRMSGVCREINPVSQRNRRKQLLEGWPKNIIIEQMNNYGNSMGNSIRIVRCFFTVLAVPAFEKIVFLEFYSSNSSFCRIRHNVIRKAKNRKIHHHNWHSWKLEIDNLEVLSNKRKKSNPNPLFRPLIELEASFPEGRAG